MPYDKGDFTQQGIDGKVAGGLLLNNKRDVDILVSTNEDDSTLGAVGVTIEDHLNDLKYAFFGENLEAGEVYEIGAGGGGGSPIRCCKINVINNDTTYDLYYDSEGYYALGQGYINTDYGSTPPFYVPELNCLCASSILSNILVAEKNGGTGTFYLVAEGMEDDGNIVPAPVCAFLSNYLPNIEITAVNNVTITENDQHDKIVSLTDITMDGELTIALTHTE